MVQDETRAELEKLGAATVRAKLLQPGAAGLGLDFMSGSHGNILTRSDVEDWLAKKHTEETRV